MSLLLSLLLTVQPQRTVSVSAKDPAPHISVGIAENAVTSFLLYAEPTKAELLLDGRKEDVPIHKNTVHIVAKKAKIGAKGVLTAFMPGGQKLVIEAIMTKFDLADGYITVVVVDERGG
ncbi:MAG: hypothetical protein IT381_33095 [Deltaproteobacteria bacterium]|nr:hypothetical protein [Deltaproteobacteria bacterium]